MVVLMLIVGIVMLMLLLTIRLMIRLLIKLRTMLRMIAAGMRNIFDDRTVVRRLMVGVLVIVERFVLVLDVMFRFELVLIWRAVLRLVLVLEMMMLVSENFVVLVIGVILEHKSVAVVFFSFRMHLLELIKRNLRC